MTSFLALEYEKFFGNEVLLKTLANKTMLFLILLKEKVDWDKTEKLNLFQEYFIGRRLIVSSISRMKLAERLGRDVPNNHKLAESAPGRRIYSNRKGLLR